MRFRGRAKKDVRFHILDTTTIRQQVLIVYAEPMAKAYGAEISSVPVWGATVNEVLVWDAIYATSASVSLQQLLKPRGRQHCANIDVLMPGLKKQPNRAAKVAKSSKKSGFEKGCDLRRKIVDHDRLIEERKAEYQNMAPKKCGQLDYAGRMHRLIHFLKREYYDPRHPLDEYVLLQWLELAEPLRADDYDLRLPWIISMLSIRLHVIQESSIAGEVKQLCQGMWARKDLQLGTAYATILTHLVGSKHGLDAKNLWFISTSLPDQPWRSGAQAFERLLKNCVLEVREMDEASVKEGTPRSGLTYARRPLIRLDADPKAIDTTNAPPAISQLLPVRGAAVAELENLLCGPGLPEVSTKPDGFVEIWMIDSPNDMLANHPRGPPSIGAETAARRRTLTWGLCLAWSNIRSDVQDFKRWKRDNDGAHLVTA
jgi:hypothetical protein